MVSRLIVALSIKPRNSKVGEVMLMADLSSVIIDSRYKL